MTRMHTARERRRADWAVLAAIALSGACLGVTVRGAAAQPTFQAPPVLRASELLPPDMLAGPLFRVDDRVPTDGLLGHFTLRSSFGVFVAPGRELLRIRIAELPAIQHLESTILGSAGGEPPRVGVRPGPDRDLGHVVHARPRLCTVVRGEVNPLFNSRPRGTE